MRLGMFDAEDQVPYNKAGYDVVDSAEMKALNLKVADSIMTLLKNDEMCIRDSNCSDRLRVRRG